MYVRTPLFFGAIFVDSGRRTVLAVVEMYMKLALRVQSQCQATLEALQRKPTVTPEVGADTIVGQSYILATLLSRLSFFLPLGCILACKQSSQYAE